MGSRSNIRLFQTAEHACGYYPERVARDLVLDPHDPALPAMYGNALAMGFRRSGAHVYRPHCLECSACRPVRIPVADFRPSRAQARCARRNADLAVAIVPARRTDENFALYKRYLAARHAGGGMDHAEPADFDAFLAGPWSPTRFVEFRHGSRLLAVAVIDAADEALSAVYTWFDPADAARGLGTFAILTQVDIARREQRAHLYLGFWLQDHPKMHYKQNYRPLEVLAGREWLRLPGNAA
jgi:arginyl-tRNA--protein-N-Asp/Glu arginylyltransferase